jgi:hypothetical protein
MNIRLIDRAFRRYTNMLNKPIACSIAILACLQTGCATPVRPDYSLQPEQLASGRLAVVAARFQPEYVFDALTPGKGSAAGRGALHAAAACAQGGRDPFSALASLFCAPIAAAIGAISGASASASAQDIEAAKASAQDAIATLNLQDTTLTAVQRYAQEMGVKLSALPPHGPAKPEDTLSYAQARDAADSVIEIAVLQAKVVTTGAAELRIALGMQTRVKVVDVREGKEIDTFTIRCHAGLRTPDGWLVQDGEAIRSAFDRCASSTAEQALDEILFIYHPKLMREQPPSSEAQRVPPYALRAIQPPIRNKVYLSAARMTYGHLERYPLDSLQPEFRWEAWPRGFDIQPGDQGDAQEIRYDLRIVGEDGFAYERRGLPTAQHRVEQALAPCRTYRWTVRARFVLGGAKRVTEWAGAFDTLGGQVSPSWIRRGRGAPALAMIPDSALPFYAIVETPGANGEACPGR